MVARRDPSPSAVAEQPAGPAVDLPLEDAFRTLSCDEHGLSEEEAAARLERYGPNRLEREHENVLLELLHYFWGPIAWMIEVAAILSAATGDWMSFGVIFALLCINGIIGFFEEHKAADAMEQLRGQLSPTARVLRSGTWKEVDAASLVPGDVVELRLGDVIPADVDLFGGAYLSVDQSALTGESLPVTRQANQTVYSGTVVKQGEMTGLVTETGANTSFGKTAKLVEKAGAKSHFQEAVLHIGTFLIYIALALSALLVAIELARGVSFIRLLAFVLILVVASIPVAMPAVLSITMALGAVALSRRKAIVTKLESIEEMAGIDILCSDKTGTLTQNQLTPSGGVTFAAPDEASLMELGALASSFDDPDAIDRAVIDGMTTSGGSIEGSRQEQFVPFDPVSKRTEATVSSADGAHYQVAKGAPQVIMDLCEMSPADRRRADDVVTSLAGKGYRTLGVAKTEPGGAWRFSGIIPLYDPPRADSKETIATAQRNGIVVKMVTGDNLAIAREISTTLDMGADIEAATSLFDEDGKPIGDVGAAIEQADGYAQVFPEHKYGIVKALQDKGHLVGMTGDGVNDAPALKQADVGIAVSGATGAAQAAADLVEFVLLVRDKLRSKHGVADEVPVAWTGGVIEKMTRVREAFFAGLHAAAPARGHHRLRRQLRLLDRATWPRSRRLRDAHDGARRRHPAPLARGRAGVGLVTIRPVSVGLAITWMCTWFWPAKNSPCPTGNWLKRFFSSLVSLNTSVKTSTALGLCLSRNCILAFATMARPMRLPIKSSTSCVMVVMPRLYLRARLARLKRKLAESSYFINCQASSTINMRRFWSVLVLFQIKFSTMYIATGRNSSSRSRTLKTTIGLLMSILDCWLKMPANVPVVYLRRRWASDGPLPPMCSRVS